MLISPDLQELLDWADAIQVLVDGRLSPTGCRRTATRRRASSPSAWRAWRERGRGVRLARLRSTSGSLVLATAARSCSAPC